MSVAHVSSVSQLNGLLSDTSKLTVIFFHATWCGPCRAISSTFEALAKEYTIVNFVKCDVDAAGGVASVYKISAMPTFIFLQGSKQIHMIRGADRTGLQNAVKRFASSSGAFSGEGHTLGGTPPQATHDLMSIWSNVDPSFKVLIGLFAAYVFFWLM